MQLAAVAPMAPLPPSPMAFFNENELLRKGLVCLNAVLACYCAAITMLFINATCHLMPWASFYCDPHLQRTAYGLRVHMVHSSAVVFFAVAVWLYQRPRGWFVKWNAVTLCGTGLVLVLFGFQQCVVATGSPSIVFSILAGLLLMLLGVVCLGGSYGASCYEKRLAMEGRVVIELILGNHHNSNNNNRATE